MISERVNNIRVGVNLAVFAVIAALVAWWTLTTLVRLDIIDTPDTVTVDFPHSTGLQENFEVTYLGLRVGIIDDVKLVPGKVTVTMHLDDGHKVPSNALADIQRKSAIGEPIVALNPPPKGKISQAVLKDGDHIPLQRATATPHYTDLFRAIDDLLTAVDKKSISTIVRELALGWKGRGEEVRQAITDMGYMLQRIGENGPLMDSLSKNLTQMTHTLAGKRNSIDRSVKQIQQIANSMSASRKNFETILDRGLDLGQRTAELVAVTAPDWGCAVDSLAPGLNDMRGLYPPLRDLFQHWYPLLHQAYNDVTATEADGPWVRVTGGVKLLGGKDGPRSYKEPLELPDPPAITDCAVPNELIADPGRKQPNQATGGELLPSFDAQNPNAPKMPGPKPDPDGKATVDEQEDLLLQLLLIAGTLLLATLVAGAMARQELKRRKLR